MLKTKNSLLPVFAIFVISFFGLNYVFAETVKTRLYTNTTDIKVGDTFLVNMEVSPEYGYPVFTLGATLKYDTSILEYVDSNFDNAWFSLGQSPYRVINKIAGQIVLTGGYTKGIDTTNKFVNYTFKVKKAGTTTLSVIDGFSYNSDTVKSFLNKSYLTVVAGEGENVKTETIKPYLNIDLLIDSAAYIYPHKDFTFKVMHPKINLNNTNINGIVSISDLNGKLIYYKDVKINTLIDSEQEVFVPKNIFNPGEYNITFNANYGDEFQTLTTSKSLTVLQRGFFETYIWPINLTYLAIIFGLLLLLSGVTAHTVHKRRLKRRKLATKVRPLKVTKIRKKSL